MSFFRKWKTNYKHKKFNSDDIMDGDEEFDYGLSPNNFDSIKLQLDGSGGSGIGNGTKCIDIGTDALHLTDNDSDSNGNNKLCGSFDIRYLGCTPIAGKPNERTTADAIAQVIANAKAGGRKNKTHKRVKLNITPEYLQVLDYQTHDTIMCFMIYKVSYCSVDAAHDHAFSFVGAERNPMSSPLAAGEAYDADAERLSCHVFLCPKRKVAHEITLLVARCFERAYQQWRDAVVQHRQQEQQRQVNNHTAFGNSSLNGKKILIESRVEVHQPQQQQQEPLIDLHVSDSDTQKYIKHSWVAFDDDSALQVAAC